jgi:hypothetical protein
MSDIIEISWKLNLCFENLQLSMCFVICIVIRGRSPVESWCNFTNSMLVTTM